MTSALGELRKIATSYLETPKADETVLRNVFRVSVWGAFGSALVSIFNKILIEEGPWTKFAPYVFKASLTSCGTCTLFAALLGFKLAQMPTTIVRASSFTKLHSRVYTLEPWLAIGSGAAYFALRGSSYLTSNQVLKSLTERFCTPIGWITIIISVIGIFHDLQLQQIEEAND